jgi:elongation factor 1 alpha-like protein
MTAVDPIHLNIGSILCPPTSIVPLAMTFTARIIVFDITMPITAGTSVRNPRIEPPHNDLDRASLSSSRSSYSTIRRTSQRTFRSSCRRWTVSTGRAVKKSPRVLTKGASAEVQITLRSAGGTSRAYSVPLETFAANKEMGRVLVRRGGETIAAGMGFRYRGLVPREGMT